MKSYIKSYTDFNRAQFSDACNYLKDFHPEWKVPKAFYVSAAHKSGAIKRYEVHLYIDGKTHIWYGQADNATHAKTEAIHDYINKLTDN